MSTDVVDRTRNQHKRHGVVWWQYLQGESPARPRWQLFHPGRLRQIPGTQRLPRGDAAQPCGLVLTKWPREPVWRQKDVITSSGSSEKTKLGARGRRLYCSKVKWGNSVQTWKFRAKLDHMKVSFTNSL